MARPKEFERDAVLEKAIKVFSAHGYEGTSTDMLLDAMSIGRQSLYDTFGDKRRLYLDALRHYNSRSVADFIGALNGAASPLKGLEAALVAFADSTYRDGTPACLGVGSICEFGRSDAEVTLLNEAAGGTLIAGLERLLEAARKAGEIDTTLSVPAAARFIAATLSGIKVAARAGASTGELRDTARMAIRSLR